MVRAKNTWGNRPVRKEMGIMSRDFVVNNDGKGHLSVVYYKTSGPLCSIDAGSFICVKTGIGYDVWGLVEDVAYTGIAVVTADDGSRRFFFDEIDDIILISDSRSVMVVADTVNELRKRYGSKLDDIIHRNRVDLDV